MLSLLSSFLPPLEHPQVLFGCSSTLFPCGFKAWRLRISSGFRRVCPVLRFLLAIFVRWVCGLFWSLSCAVFSGTHFLPKDGTCSAEIRIRTAAATAEMARLTRVWKSNNNSNQIRNSRFFFFYSLLTAPRTVSNTYAQVARAQSCANHLQHVDRLSRATCRVTCHVVRRDISPIKFDRV